MTTIKAKRAQITLGDQVLDVFQLPNGDYVFSSTGLVYLFGGTEKQYLPKYMSESLKVSLPETLNTFQVEKISIEGNNTQINTIPLELVKYIARYKEKKGNLKAKGIVDACIDEALERRADAAFGVIRNEEERNERFVTRRDSILSRNFWTDVIEDYIKTHEVSDNYKRFVHINVSNYLNKALFNMNSKQIRAHYDIGDNSPRDYFPSDTLKLVDTIEKATAVRVQNNDVCPKQALKDVVMLLGIEPDANRL